MRRILRAPVTSCHTFKYKDEDGEDSKTYETLKNEVFDLDEEEMLDANAGLPE